MLSSPAGESGRRPGGRQGVEILWRGSGGSATGSKHISYNIEDRNTAPSQLVSKALVGRWAIAACSRCSSSPCARAGSAPLQSGWQTQRVAEHARLVHST